MDGNRGIDGCHLSPVQGMPAGSVLSQTGAKKGGCVHIPCSGGRGSAAIGIHRSSRSIRRLCCVCRRVQRTSTFESLRSGREREKVLLGRTLPKLAVSLVLRSLQTVPQTCATATSFLFFSYSFVLFSSEMGCKSQYKLDPG